VLSVITVVLWGSLPLALKAVAGRMSPVTLTWYRYAVSLAILTPIVWRRRLLPNPARMPRGTLVLFGVSLAGFVGNNLVYLWGLTKVSPSSAQVVIQLAPLLTMVGAVFLFKEHFSNLQWWGVVLLVSGMIAFFHRHLGTLLRAEGPQAPGVGMIIVAAAMWAGYAMAQKVLLRQFPSMAIMWMNYAGGLILLGPAAAPAEIHLLSGALLFLLLYCCVNGLVGYGTYAEAMSQWEASRVSAVVANAPLFTIVFTAVASAFFPEVFQPDHLTWISVAGALAVVMGSVLAAGIRILR
jgi:drug/metabolite transporter (DMT)-like permease